nr:undecaprenyl-phosphate glucose phosphotransferase [uncultured Rhodoferax sp.]
MPLFIRNSPSLTDFIVQTLDFTAICIGGWLAYQFRFATDGGWATPHPQEILLVFILALFSSFLFSKLYKLWSGGALASMVSRVTLGWLISWLSLLLILTLTKTSVMYSRTWLVTWLLFTIGTLWLGRAASFFLMAQMRRSGYQHKRVLLIGESTLMDTVQQRVQNATWSGFEIVGTECASKFDEVTRLDAELRPDEIWIGLRMQDHNLLDGLTQALNQSMANIRLLPDLMMYQILNHGISVTLGIPMVDISVSPMAGWQRLAKATLDIVVACVILMLITPLLVVIAIAVKLSSPGPVLFKQKRHGWNGEEILVYKFRSMVVHQEAAGHVTQARRKDPRVTRVGAFLRKTSLDELPQFINVLQGRMSVVGPRPHALAHNQEYMKKIPFYALRHKAKPGITGWAQICGYRGETDTLDKMEGRIKHDIYYLEHWSVWMDLKIIFLTPVALIQNKNVF